MSEHLKKRDLSEAEINEIREKEEKRNEGKCKPIIPDDTPEFRAESAERVTEFLSRSGIIDIFCDDEKRNEKLASVTPEDVETFLERMNGIILGLPDNQRIIYSHGGSVVFSAEGHHYTMHASPSISVQNKTVRRYLNSVLQLKPERQAELAALLINQLHSFADGNGRLSRLVYQLLLPENRFPGDKEDLREIKLGRIKRDLLERGDLIITGKEVKSYAEGYLNDRINIKYPEFANVFYFNAFNTEIDITGDEPRQTFLKSTKERLYFTSHSTFLAMKIYYLLFLKDRGVPIEDVTTSPTEKESETLKVPQGYTLLDIVKISDYVKTYDDLVQVRVCVEFINEETLKMFIKFFAEENNFPSPDSSAIEGETMVDYLLDTSWVLKEDKDFVPR